MMVTRAQGRGAEKWTCLTPGWWRDWDEMDDKITLRGYLASHHVVPCAMASPFCYAAGYDREIPQRHLAGCLGFFTAKKNLTAIIALCYPGNKQKPHLVNPRSWPQCLLIRKGMSMHTLKEVHLLSQAWNVCLVIYLFIYFCSSYSLKSCAVKSFLGLWDSSAGKGTSTWEDDRVWSRGLTERKRGRAKFTKLSSDFRTHFVAPTPLHHTPLHTHIMHA